MSFNQKRFVSPISKILQGFNIDICIGTRFLIDLALASPLLKQTAQNLNIHGFWNFRMSQLRLSTFDFVPSPPSALLVCGFVFSRKKVTRGRYQSEELFECSNTISQILTCSSQENLRILNISHPDASSSLIR